MAKPKKTFNPNFNREAVAAEYVGTDHIMWRGHRIPRSNEAGFDIVFQGKVAGTVVRVMLGTSEWISWFSPKEGLGFGSGGTPKAAITRAFTNMKSRANKALKLFQKLDTWR